MFDSVILDADSLLFLCCYEEPSFELRKKKFERRITEIIGKLEAQDLVCLIKGKDNFRVLMNVDYKGNRKDPNEAEQVLRKRVSELADWATESIATPSHGGEADDYAGIIAYQMIAEGKRPIIAHIDKDLDQLYGYHYNFNKDLVYFVEPEEGYRMLMKQCLMGDKTDNIQGLPKYGPVTVGKLLDTAPPENLWGIVKGEWEKLHGKEYTKYLSVCANLVWMRTKDTDLRALDWDEIEREFQWITDDGQSQQPLAACLPELLVSFTSSPTESQIDDMLEKR